MENRSCDVKGDSVSLRQDGVGVGPDLVEDGVFGDSVGADDHLVNLREVWLDV